MEFETIGMVNCIRNTNCTASSVTPGILRCRSVPTGWTYSRWDNTLCGLYLYKSSIFVLVSVSKSTISCYAVLSLVPNNPETFTPSSESCLMNSKNLQAASIMCTMHLLAQTLHSMHILLLSLLICLLWPSWWGSLVIVHITIAAFVWSKGYMQTIYIARYEHLKVSLRNLPSITILLSCLYVITQHTDMLLEKDSSLNITILTLRQILYMGLHNIQYFMN